MKCAVVTSTTPDCMAALDGLCDRLLGELGPARPDLVIVFFTPHHSGDAQALRARLLERLAPRVLLGGPGEGVIGGDVEIEGRTGLTLFAACWPGAQLVPFRLEIDEEDGEPALVGWPAEVPEGAGFLVVADPYTTPGDVLLAGFHKRWPGAPVVGGMSSGTGGPGQGLLLDVDGVHEEGCVGLALGGSVVLEPVVSQGCRPVGHHFVVTKAQQNVILALGGKPALTQLRAIFSEVGEADRHLMQSALHVGRVVDERKSSFERRDLLVRNVLGIDPRNEALAINDYVRAGQTIQFMVRDSAAASDDLSTLLAEQAARGPSLGALLFSCNGRGTRFFGAPHHDVRGIQGVLGELPVAGFFAAGEIGSVGGHPFLHGFTASIALLRERAAKA